METRQAAKARHAVILQRELRQRREVRGQILQARDSVLPEVEFAQRREGLQPLDGHQAVVLQVELLQLDARLQTLDARNFILREARATHPRQTIEVGQTTHVATLQRNLLHGFPPSVMVVVDDDIGGGLLSSPVVPNARLANRLDQLADAAARVSAPTFRVFANERRCERRAALRRLLAIARGHRHAVQGLEPRQST